MSPPATVGFVGLGQIGAPMARRWLDWPGGLTVFDVVPEATEPFAEGGAHVARDLKELAERSDVVSVMVRDDRQVREVVLGADGLAANARPGGVIAIHSTVDATTPAELAEQVAGHDIHVVDAPVSGGWMGAQEGTLAVMVGGSGEAVERVREPFGAFATLVAHMGPVGAGTRAKLARNLITFVSYVAGGEAQRLAEAGGVDLGLLGDVVRHSDKVTGGPGAPMVRKTTAPLDRSDGLYDIFAHTRGLGEKDLQLALGLADELGIDLPVTRLALDHFAAAIGVPHEQQGETDG